MNIIVKMKFGSHLYGTDTEESDTDYKGVFIPSTDKILLGRIPKSIVSNTKEDIAGKNSPDDIDTELYSLHYFLDLACKGETVAMDMLHAPKDMILESTTTWDNIVNNRKKFYTSNLSAFIGYARKQASKYGIKGSRINDAKVVLDYLTNIKRNKDLKLKDIWNDLPIGEHINKISTDVQGVRFYEICGRKIGDTVSIEYARSIVEKFHNNYGERAKMAAKNEGIDWKAVSHAVRVAFQLQELLKDGTISFPLREAVFLKEVKQGEYSFKEMVSPLLDALMDEVEELAKESKLPKMADREFWDAFLLKEIYFRLMYGDDVEVENVLDGCCP